jgi:hypothetical protein
MRDIIRRLFGSTMQRATVDLAHPEGQRLPPDRAAYLRQDPRAPGLTPGQLRKLRKLNPIFARTEAATLETQKATAAERRKATKKGRK